MGATMFLLGLVFTAFILAIVLLLARFSNVGTGGIVVLAVLVGVAISFGSYYWSDRIALSTAGARVVGPGDSAEAAKLHGIIDRLCALADMPKPRVAIAPTSMPNAFATGRSSKQSVVCVTRGMLDRLEDNELEGVLAHEMSHVAHRDVAVMTIASFIGIIAALMVRFAFYSELFGGGGRGGRRSGNDQNSALIAFGVLVVGMVVYAISFLLIRLLSRYRELSADRSGALLTGQPHVLASALVKVSDDIARIPSRDLRAAEPLNAFFFAPAVALQRGQLSLATIFSTHPPLEKRLKALDQVAKQLSR
jgi:heat shock protein HtpX